MKFPLTIHDGLQFRLLLIRPNWATAPVVVHQLDTLVGEGRTTIEERRPEREALLLTHKYLISPVGTEADDWAKGCAALGGGRVAVPLWVDVHPVAEWSARKYEPQKVINFTPGTADFVVYDVSELPETPAFTHYAPLLLGRWKQRPPAAPDTEDDVDVTIELTEARPFSWRIGVNAYGSGWAKDPNWISPPKVVNEFGLELVSLPGAAGEPATDRDNAAARWSQEAEFFFLSPLEIRTALTTFVDKRGSWATIAPLPAWFQPGAPTGATPDNYTARFASDSLTLTFASPACASARIGFLQEVNTPGRDQAVPGEAYLYRLAYDHDPANPELLTNWDAPLVGAEGTYLPAQVAHQEIVRSLKPQDERAEIQLAYVAGSLAADWIRARLYGLLRLTIWKCDPDDPAATQGEPLFNGIVQEVRPEGNTLTLSATLFGAMLSRRMPGWVFGPRCNTYLFSPLCGLTAGDFDATGTIAPADVSADGMTITVHGAAGWGGPAFAANHFAYGTARTGSDRGTMIATIVASEMSGGDLIVKLNRPFWSDLVAGGGQAVTLEPGCGGQYDADCVGRYNNATRFRGFPFVPEFIEQRSVGSPSSPKK